MKLSEQDKEDITDMVIDSRDIDDEETADEMFKKLDYTKTLDEEYIIYYEKGSNIDEETGRWYGTLHRIYIDKEHKVVGKEEDHGNNNTENDIFTFKEIQAVNKKLEELGWI